jgi:hypothetical protein
MGRCYAQARNRKLYKEIKVPEKYKPITAEEYLQFIKDHCNYCVQESECRILIRVIENKIDDPEYPNEWIMQSGKGICTAMKVKE